MYGDHENSGISYTDCNLYICVAFPDVLNPKRCDKRTLYYIYKTYILTTKKVFMDGQFFPPNKIFINDINQFQAIGALKHISSKTMFSPRDVSSCYK